MSKEVKVLAIEYAEVKLADYRCMIKLQPQKINKICRKKLTKGTGPKAV